MRCYGCRQEASAQCPRCGRWFCRDHGGGQCDRCRAPASLLPSTLLYRGAVALLVLSMGLAIWHLAVWPAFPEPTQSAALAPLPQEEEATTPPERPTGEALPSPSPSLPPSPSPEATLAPTATPAPTPTSQVRRYVVEAGDNLNSIAARFGTTVSALVEANNIADPALIRVGQELVIP